MCHWAKGRRNESWKKKLPLKKPKKKKFQLEQRVGKPTGLCPGWQGLDGIPGEVMLPGIRQEQPELSKEIWWFW